MVTPRSFLRGIYQEHFEELGFMYERRLQWLDDPDLTFEDIGELEERMEAHLDGLVLGEEIASEVCFEGLSGEDFGTFYSATSVFCRQECWDLVEQTLDCLDEYVQGADESEFEDVLRARKAMADALAFHAPSHWERSIVEGLKLASPAVVPVLARCAGYRRFEDAGKILCEVASRQGSDAEDVLWALGRVHHPDAVEVLRYHALWGGARTATAATISGLRMGDRYMLQVLKDRAHGENWPAIPLAIGGGVEELPILLKLTEPNRVTSESLIALGVFGDIRVASHLVDGLSSKRTAEASAAGLYFLTGKEVLEEREVPQDDAEYEVEEDDDSNVEEVDAKGFGQVISIKNTSLRLSQQADQWVEQINLLRRHANVGDHKSNTSGQFPKFTRINCLRTLLSPFYARITLLERLAIEEPNSNDLEREHDVLRQRA